MTNRLVKDTTHLPALASKEMTFLRHLHGNHNQEHNLDGFNSEFLAEM